MSSLVSRIPRSVVLLAAVVASNSLLGNSQARGDTLNSPMFAPITFVDRVDMRYSIVSGEGGAAIGKFTATGRAKTIDGVAIPDPKGTMVIEAYFNPSTGTIFKDHSNDLFDPKLEVRDQSSTLLYFSRHIHLFAFNLSATYPTFDFEWYNEGGTLANSNPLPYIGSVLRNSTTFTGSKSFVSALPINSLVFDNQLNGIPVEGGTANVFMTPTPTAVGGGAILLLCVVAVGKFGATRLR